LIRIDVSIGVDATHAETGVAVEPIVREIQTVFDQHRSRESVVADAVAPHPGITQWQGEDEEHC
jgi:hypothetical protein